MGRTRHADVDAYIADQPEPLADLLGELRHVKVRPGERVPEVDLRSLLREAFRPGR